MGKIRGGNTGQTSIPVLYSLASRGTETVYNFEIWLEATAWTIFPDSFWKQFQTKSFEA